MDAQEEAAESCDFQKSVRREHLCKPVSAGDGEELSVVREGETPRLMQIKMRIGFATGRHILKHAPAHIANRKTPSLIWGQSRALVPEHRRCQPRSRFLPQAKVPFKHGAATQASNHQTLAFAKKMQWTNR